MILRVLISVSHSRQRRRLGGIVRKLGHLATIRRGREDLWHHLRGQSFDFVLVDQASVAASGGNALSDIRAVPGPPEILVIDVTADAEAGAALVTAGCMGVLSPTLPDDELQAGILAYFERRIEKVHLALEAAGHEEYRLGDFVSVSPSMRQLMAMARRVGSADTSVLILGETGVGKESLARALHSEGPRSTGPFIAVNCAAIPEGLFESELFGHCKGAFTGATRDHRGHFEMAHRGTIFLDEIGELPHHMQVKLLRVLQDHRITPVGGEVDVEVDVRVIAATNRDPDDLIARGQLREDLYYRLGVITLKIPPLKERREDIVELAQNYFEIFCAKLGRRLDGVEPDVLSALQDYAWPGNVRELINVMERAVLLAGGETLGLDDLPDEITHIKAGPRPQMAPGKSRPVRAARPERYHRARSQVIESFERAYITALLENTRGRIGEAAILAGMSTRTLHHKMKHLGIRKADFRCVESR